MEVYGIETGNHILTRREIKSSLDRFLISQDDFKRVLAVEIHRHMKRYLSDDFITSKKRNIIIAGPTGSGKSYGVKLIAEILDVPFLEIDANDFTETGYVGSDPDHIPRQLLELSGGDVEKAQRGIVYIDEIDKLAGGSTFGNQDISRNGVQRALLKLIEGKKIPVYAPHDREGMSRFNREKEAKINQLFSKLYKERQQSGALGLSNEAIREEAKKIVEKSMPSHIDTTNILFIAGGSFMGDEGRPSLSEIVETRKRNGSSDKVIGFISDSGKSFLERSDRTYPSEILPEDFISFGLLPELVGRFPAIAVLDDLTKYDLVNILKKNTDDSALRDYQRSFSEDGVTLEFTEDALEAIAEKALALGTNARGLDQILFQVLKHFEYGLEEELKPGTVVKITKETVENPEMAFEEFKRELGIKLRDYQKPMILL